jgi:hypothetical protein
MFRNSLLRSLVCAACAVFLSALSVLAQNSPNGAPVQGVPQDRSTVIATVVITTGNTFQQVLASIIGTTNYRAWLMIQNNNASDNCWIFPGTVANATKATSMLLLPGGSYSRAWPFVPSDVIAATCANNNDTLYLETQ